MTPTQARRARRERQARGVTLDKRRRRFVGREEDGRTLALVVQVERHVVGEIAERSAEIRDRRGLTGAECAARDDERDRDVRRAEREQRNGAE